MIDRHALVATLKPLVVELEDSIRTRALGTPEVADHLEQEHRRAIAAGRTGMSLEEWRDGEVTQAAVAWVLACVFVRFLEDNGLIDQALISGPGDRRAAALGHREEYFRAHPAHSDREYLEACFREVAEYPAVAPLYDERHNPLWRLTPTADGARTLRETFTAIDPAEGNLVHDFSDLGRDTRFLGDLYQDLSDVAKKRYALLQTPDFVEQFILDRTLTPAIDEFGADNVRLIDPTCGSGHFLIGAFERLFALRIERDAGTTRAVSAQRSLDQVAGVDRNPFATAIARFRLVIAALRACDIARLAEAPAFTLHLATGDSLLHGPLPADGATMRFDANRLHRNIAHVFETEDSTELKRILGLGYHAVVGNPPYIRPVDPAARLAYRSRYASCHREYALTVPFMERFFELAQSPDPARPASAGFVGKITGNSFLKREFGEKLVEQFLPGVEVDVLIDSSGLDLAGHGTPTLMLFGRGRARTRSTLLVADSLRGENRASAEQIGWRALLEAMATGESNQFFRVKRTDRSDFATHPITLGPGRDLLKRIKRNSSSTLADVASAIGLSVVSGEDAIFAWDISSGVRNRVTGPTRSLVEGDGVRNWSLIKAVGLWTHGDDYAPADETAVEPLMPILWPFRRVLNARKRFGVPIEDLEIPWYAWREVYGEKHKTPTAIVCPLVESHPHFVLDRSGALFRHSATVVKLRDESPAATLRILGALNSSIVCFVLQQLCHNKGAGGGKSTGAKWNDFFEFNASNMRDVPLALGAFADLAGALDDAAGERTRLLDGIGLTVQGRALKDHLAALEKRDAALVARLVSLQEELDWQALAAYSLVPDDVPILGESAPPIEHGQRAFEVVLARQIALGETDKTWFERHGSKPITEVPAEWPADYRASVERRIRLIESDPDVGLVERPEYKRRWSGAPWAERQRDALTTLVLDTLERQDVWSDLRPRSTAELTDILRLSPLMVEALDLLADTKDSDLAATVRRLVLDASVPLLAAERMTSKGLRKREVWERVWELQRAQDRGATVASIPIPPKYAQADFQSATYWRHRGKLDVPKERFVLISHAGRGADSSPVVCWAGWNQRDLARALAGRITELRQEHAAGAERLVPLLASVFELLPWVHQWYPESDPLFGGPPGAFFENWLDGELAALGVTRDTLRAWRPSAPIRGRKAKA